MGEREIIDIGLEVTVKANAVQRSIQPSCGFLGTGERIQDEDEPKVGEK